MVKFSSRRTISEVLKEKVKKYQQGMKEQGGVNENPYPYYIGLWGKCKGFWQDKTISSLFTIDGIICIKKSEHKFLITTHDDL